MPRGDIRNIHFTVHDANGDVVIYEQLEFVWSTSDKKWHEFGSTGSLKGLAFKDSASASAPAFKGTSATITTK